MTSIFASSSERGDRAAAGISRSVWAGPTTNIFENIAAAYDNIMRNEMMVSFSDDMKDAYEEILAPLNAGKGPDERLANPYASALNPSVPNDTGYEPRFDRGTREEKETALFRALDELRARDPAAAANLPGSPEEVQKRVIARGAQAFKTYADVHDRQGFLGFIGEFLGASAAIVQDPPVLLSMAFGAPVSAGIVRAALVEGALGLGSEVVRTPNIMEQRERIGEPIDATELATRLGLSAAIPAGLTGALKSGAALLGARARAAKSLEGVDPGGLVKKFDRDLPPQPERKQGARDYLETAHEIAGTNPSKEKGTLPGHLDKLAKAMSRIERGEPPPEEPIAPLIGSPKTEPRPIDAGGYNPVQMRPEDLIVDAKTYQYKAGGDAEGVTGSLGNITVWDDIKKGVSLVHQRLDGRFYIADGHQRRGLAMGLKAKGLAKDPTLSVIILREEDGWTVKKVRGAAALKNIAEGSGTAFDAAKAFRDAPELVDGSMPTTRPLVRMAKELGNLDEEAFGIAIHSEIPEAIAAVVGRLVPANDPGLQRSIMGLLAKLEPANAGEAESIVRQAMESGTSKEIQTTLFGDEEVTQSLYLERARVLERTLKAIRHDARLFKALVKDQDVIAAAGNTLSTAANEARVQLGTEALALLRALANRKGPLSDALTQAAQRAKADGKFGPAVADFLGAVRRGIEGGDLDGLRPGGPGRDSEGPSTDRPSEGPGEGDPAQEGLKLFEEPAGEGQQAQLEFLTGAARADAELPGTPLHDAADKPPLEQFKEGAGEEFSKIDEPFPLATAQDGTPLLTTVRDILSEIDDDAAFLKALKECD